MAIVAHELCPHYAASPANVAVQDSRCAECGIEAPTRVCMSCGHVGCCESMNGHATAHARSSGHPIIRSLPLSPSSFIWCYDCNAYLK